MTLDSSKTNEPRRWKIKGGETDAGTPYFGVTGPPISPWAAPVEVMPVAEHEAAMADAEEELLVADGWRTLYTELREAAKVAVDDLYKAANQFAGLKPGGNNARIFTEKAERLEAALAPANREETNDGQG